MDAQSHFCLDLGKKRKKERARPWESSSCHRQSHPRKKIRKKNDGTRDVETRVELFYFFFD